MNDIPALKNVADSVAARPRWWLEELRKGDPVGVFVVVAKYHEEIYVEEELDGGSLKCSDGYVYSPTGVCDQFGEKARVLVRPSVESAVEFRLRKMRTEINQFPWRQLAEAELNEVLKLLDGLRQAKAA